MPFNFLPICPGENTIGTHCNISSDRCRLLKPCQNNGSCLNTTDTVGYVCQCLPGFDDEHCQYDRRPCQPTTCWNDGKALVFSEEIDNAD